MPSRLWAGSLRSQVRFYLEAGDAHDPVHSSHFSCRRCRRANLARRVVHAVDALPDARFVGFAETVNDFEIQSGQLALTKSSNEPVRGYATRAIAEHTAAAQSLS